MRSEPTIINYAYAIPNIDSISAINFQINRIDIKMKNPCEGCRHSYDNYACIDCDVFLAAVEYKERFVSIPSSDKKVKE